MSHTRFLMELVLSILGIVGILFSLYAIHYTTCKRRSIWTPIVILLSIWTILYSIAYVLDYGVNGVYCTQTEEQLEVLRIETTLDTLEGKLWFGEIAFRIQGTNEVCVYSIKYEDLAHYYKGQIVPCILERRYNWADHLTKYTIVVRI